VLFDSMNGEFDLRDLKGPIYLSVLLGVPVLVGPALHFLVIMNPPEQLSLVEFILSLIGIQFTLGSLLIATSSIYEDKNEYLADIFFIIASMLLLSGISNIFYLLLRLTSNVFQHPLFEILHSLFTIFSLTFSIAPFYAGLTFLGFILFTFSPTPFTSER
jgi:hypothetical protein